MSGKIVIIDDDQDLVEMLKVAFKASNFEVIAFLEGQSAMTYLSNKKKIKTVDLVIFDRLLPDVDGLDLIYQLKEQFKKEELPLFLILSALSSEEDVMQGLEKGATEYMTKPFSLEILIDAVKALIAKFRN